MANIDFSVLSTPHGVRLHTHTKLQLKTFKALGYRLETKKTQLSLGKTRSSCCSTDLQGRSKSMISILFEKAHATFY